MAIRQMTKEDITRVAEIHIYAGRVGYREIIPDQILFKERNVIKAIDKYTKALNDDKAELFVYDDGLLKGFMTIGKCRDDDKPNSFEIWNIYVEPFMHGKGIGSQLLEFAKAQAKEKGYNEIALWVFEKNNKARTFYKKNGFEYAGKTKRAKEVDVAELRYEIKI